MVGRPSTTPKVPSVTPSRRGGRGRRPTTEGEAQFASIAGQLGPGAGGVGAAYRTSTVRRWQPGLSRLVSVWFCGFDIFRLPSVLGPWAARKRASEARQQCVSCCKVGKSEVRLTTGRHTNRLVDAARWASYSWPSTSSFRLLAGGGTATPGALSRTEQWGEVVDTGRPEASGERAVRCGAVQSDATYDGSSERLLVPGACRFQGEKER
ncbi:hypothetical protein F5X68DRAFT_23395 [Plectosphaerella plurivora]|uniref:Uncharacterized protein n=1 Tax=Plectosphaerella plurivora TaxID=936078 RepID=A0A9P8V8F5_9PEZI|nr:hypothetical protein F5X68DRAFT_23395 [Plectosphaerella plurivora]